MNGRPGAAGVAKLLAAVAILAAIALLSASFSSLLAGLAAVAAVLLLIGGIIAALGVHVAGWDPVSEDDFDKVVERTERLAASGLYVDPDEHEFMELDPYLDDHFEEIVAGYQDERPLRDGWRARIPLHQLHPLAVHAAGHGPSYGVALAEAARATVDLP